MGATCKCWLLRWPVKAETVRNSERSFELMTLKFKGFDDLNMRSFSYYEVYLPNAWPHAD